MSEAAETVLKKTRDLSLEDPELVQLRLAERIEHEKEGIRIAEERLAEVERGEVEMIPFEEVMESLRSRTQRLGPTRIRGRSGMRRRSSTI